MPSPVTALRTERLSKSYGRQPALLDLDLEVVPGEIFGFLGPNGAGKSTTIRLLLDLIRPTAGRCEVLGSQPRRGGAQLRRRIGYLPGDFRVDDRQRVGDTLRFLGRLRGGVDDRRIRSFADRLDLDLSRTFRELSKGNRQKVGLIQAFAHEPELLILDEPTSGLDPLLQREFVTMVRQVRADGRTVFMSSHIMSEVQATADRVGIVRAGRLIAVDSVESLRERAVRRVEVHFTEPVGPQEFSRLPGITDVQTAAGPMGTVLTCRLGGPADELIKALARHGVHTLEVNEPDLEEVFLALYDVPTTPEADSRVQA